MTTTAERFISDVIARVPYDVRLRDQIAMEVRSHIAERVERGESEASAIAQLGDPVTLAESYLASIPLVSASFLTRAAARIIDFVLFMSVMGAAGFMIWLALDRPEIGGLVAFMVFASIALLFPGFALYTAIAEHTYSTTVGKRLLGLRVVRESGGRISFGQALVRQLPMFFEMFWIDALFALLTDRSQRAFELVSKTRVVRAQADGQVPAVSGPPVGFRHGAALL